MWQMFRRGVSVGAGLAVSVIAVVVLHAAASYPSAVKTFTTRTLGDVIQAAHVNDLQDEVTAVETGILNGFAHAIVPLTDALYDLGSSTKNWRDGWFSRNLSVEGTLTSTGAISGPGSVPTGAMMHFNLAACPSGWTDRTTTFQGFYLINP